MEGMWGGIKRPAAIREIKLVSPRLRVRSGKWRKTAALRLRHAVRTGELPLYVAGPEGDAEPLQVPSSITSRMIWASGHVSDHMVRTPRAWLRDGLVSADLYERFCTGTLHVLEAEFDKWFRSERARGLWRSQLTRRKPRRGRPRKRDEKLRQWIIGAVESGGWTAAKGIPALSRYLRSLGRDCPSDDTLTREVDELYRETEDSRYRRRTRAKNL
jgi:hypothetical protein